ncbi:MAG: CDP-alcohol phosphatidyltransferase family protein, partial [Pseudomonadota bacterium]
RVVLAILMREVLVSGLREYLGDVKLPVTRLAKWKTTVQMVAIGALLLTNLAQWRYEALYYAGVPDLTGPERAYVGVFWAALVLIWLAAALTVVTGVQYWRRGLAHMRGGG